MDHTITPARRLTAWLAVGVLAVAGVLVDARSSARAQSDDPTVREARAEEQRLRDLLDVALEEQGVERGELQDLQALLDRAQDDLREAEGQLALAEEALVDAQARREAAEKNLEIATRLLGEAVADLEVEQREFADQVVITYKFGAAGRGQMFLTMMQTSKTPSDFVSGLYRLGAVIDHQDGIVDRISALRTEREDLQAEADRERATAEENRLEAVATLEFVTDLAIQAAALRDRVAQAEADQAAVLRRVSSEAGDLQRRLTAAEKRTKAAEAEARRRALAARGGVLCPIDPVWFSNDWGYPRSGGRSHKGTDMFANEGTPIVAIADGIVRKLDHTDTYVPGSSRGDLGGISISYWIDDSEYWYFAHLQRLADGLREDGPVSGGQVIGWVGHTGNAYNTPPHAHVGRYVNGSAVNPYETMRVACG